jgi:hypothetical protein
MKIGITLGLKDNKESIWTNGIKQNVLMLVHLLNNSEENNLRKKDKFARGLAVGLVGSAAALMAKAIKDKNEYK